MYTVQPSRNPKNPRRPEEREVFEIAFLRVLRVFVVKAASNPPRRLEESRRVSGQWKNSFQLEKDFGVSSTDLYHH